MGWTIAVVVVDDASRSILIDRAATAAGAGASGAGPSGADAPGAASADAGAPRLPTIELPDGEPSADLAFDLIERLLGRPVAPLWMHYEEADDELVSGVGAIMILADPPADTFSKRVGNLADPFSDQAADPDATLELVPADQVVDMLEPPLPRPYIRAWLDRLAGNRDPRTPPWLEPGWHGRASQWIAERMTAAGTPPTGPTRMTYQSPIGMVLRTPAADRDVYLKCSAPQFHAEASITRALAARTPAWVPDVIDIEPAEGWLLMADLGSRQLGSEPEAAWAEGARRLGEIQRAWVSHGDELLAAGAQHRPIAMLRQAVPGLLEVRAKDDGGGIDGLGSLGARLDAASLEQWPAVQARLVNACLELEDIGLPESLIHGDAHPWNVAVTPRGLVVFDWSDAAIGPSFVDLAVFLFRTKDVAVRRALRDAYLDAWAGIAPRGRLEHAAELAMSVGSLYQVMTYLTLLPGLPPEDQVVWAGADAHWLRNAIDALDRGLDAVDQRVRAGG